MIGTNSDEVLVKKITINADSNEPHFTDEGIFKRNSFSRPLQMLYDKLNQTIYILSNFFYILKFKANEKKIEVYKIKETKKVIKRLKQRQ